MASTASPLQQSALPLSLAALFLLTQWPVPIESSDRISAILHQDAFLPCETRRSINLHVHSRPSKSDPINIILWYREGSSLPFYSIDARDLDDLNPNDLTQFSAKGKHFKSDTRLEFDLSDSNHAPLLRIRNVTEEDEGMYQCRVEYRGQPTFISQIRLNVIGAPDSLQITDSKGNPLEGVIGPFNEFESITLVCTAYGGRPKPSVVWWKQRGFYEELVDDSYEYIPLDSPINGTLSSVANVLNLRRLDRNDYLAKYLCRADTTKRSYFPPMVQFITIDMNLLPISVRIYSNQYHTSPQTSPLIAGQLAEFGCKTDGSKPAANIEWFLDHQRIVITKTDSFANYYVDLETTTTSGQAVSGQLSNSSAIIAPLPLSVAASSTSAKFVSIIGSQKANSTLSVIRFLPQYSDNGRILSCHASNPFIANSEIIDKLALDVKYAPHLTIGLGTKHDILEQSTHFTVQPGDHLPDLAATSANLSQWPKSVLVGEHSPLLELNCHIRANPWIDQVIWHRNGAVINAASTPLEPFYSAFAASTFSAQFEAHTKRTSAHQTPAIYLTNHNQTLRLENVARFHAGRYQCAARNAINVTSSEVVQLNVAYKPQCTTNKTHFIDVSRNVPLQLPCQVDANPADRLTFHWSLLSPWTAEEIEFNHSDFERESVQENGTVVSLLDVERAVAAFEETEKLKTEAADEQPSDHSTLLLQCDAANVAGRQETPCAYLLRIVDGPPQKVSNCTFTVERAEARMEAPNNRAEIAEAAPTAANMLTNANNNRSVRGLNASSLAVIVRCLAGRDGGKVQTFHLIGLLAGSAARPHDTKLSSDGAHASDQQQQDWEYAANVSSIIELIQSIQSSGSVPAAAAEQARPPATAPAVHWNVSANEVAQFVLVNVTVGQRYDLIIYADNLIGRSAPLLYRNLLLLNDSAANQANVATASSRPNWAYLRFKGLVLVLALVLIMALIGLAIRSYLSTASSYERGTTSSLGDVSTELNEAETMLRQQDEEQLPPPEPPFAAGSRAANQSEAALEEDGSLNCEISTALNEAAVASTEQQDRASYCSIASASHTHLGALLGRHLSAVKRFLNRFVFISSSHYRSYELTPCEAVCAVPPAAEAATSALDSSAATQQPARSDSSDSPPEVIHSHSEQEYIDWEAVRASLPRFSTTTTKRSKLFKWLSRSKGATDKALHSTTADLDTAANGAANSDTNKNVQLLYIFRRKL